MSIQLRDYQADLLNRARDRFRAGDTRVLIQSSTGSGKTVCAASMATTANGVLWFCVHRIELCRQTALTFRKAGLNPGIVAAGHDLTPSARVQIVLIQSLKAREKHLPTPNILVFDECQNIVARTQSEVIERHPQAKVIGLSATPVRGNGDGLGTHFQSIVCGPSTPDLIKWGNLSPCMVYAPSAPDMAGVRIVGGDYAQVEAQAAMERAKLTGDMIDHWRRLANGKRTIGFACSVEHSRAMANAFNDSGIPAAHLDGECEKEHRAQVLADFAHGKIMVVWNYALFVEGTDLGALCGCPDLTVDAIIMARPTKSLSVWLQACGRGMRPKTDGSACIILDHSGCALEHGLPQEAREWTLDAKRKAKDEVVPVFGPWLCKACFAMGLPPRPQCCPQCGAVTSKMRAEIKAEEGELRLIQESMAASKRALELKEEKACRSMQDFLKIERARGYKSGWALRRWQNSWMNRRSI